MISYLIAARTIFFIACLFNNNLFSYKYIEIVPLIVALGSGIYSQTNGYRPARFFVIGYSFLFLGVLLKILIALEVSWLPYGPVTHYSLSFCFIAEMILVSFAIGDRVKLLRKEREQAQTQIIAQMKENEQLKDILNKELESQVQERTKEIIEKSHIIESQNEELLSVNNLLKEQADEIVKMNVLLKQHNIELQTNVEKVTMARVLSAEVNFEEFSRIYPNDEACFKFLSELKWANGYVCRKCENHQYFQGQLPFSRRCTKCGYEESVIANTIFHNTRIPVNKAFYMVFLVYSSKGKISSHKLSEILSIRQSTCWSYSVKIKKVMEERKGQLKKAGDQGWSKLVLS